LFRSKRALLIELEVVQVDVFHPLGKLVAQAWEATTGAAAHLFLELLQLFHGRHTAAWHSTTEAGHTWHLWHAATPVRILWLLTLAVFTLAAFRLLLSG